jgi:hypothetical protein
VVVPCAYKNTKLIYTSADRLERLQPTNVQVMQT